MSRLFNKITSTLSLLKLYLTRDPIHLELKQRPEYRHFILIEYKLLQLYRAISGADLSQAERKTLLNDEDAFIYGEIQFLPFFALLEKAMPRKGEVFYDLGSGIGKAVFTAALYFDFKKTVGIECLPGLNRAAHTQLQKATDYLIPIEKLAPIQFVEADFLNYDFSDANIIFINATCFSYSTWEQLVAKFKLLKSGSRLIVTTKKMPADAFEVIQQSFALMSWGVNLVRIYLKK